MVNRISSIQSLLTSIGTKPITSCFLLINRHSRIHRPLPSPYISQNFPDGAQSALQELLINPLKPIVP